MGPWLACRDVAWSISDICWCMYYFVFCFLTIWGQLYSKLYSEYCHHHTLGKMDLRYLLYRIYGYILCIYKPFTWINEVSFSHLLISSIFLMSSQAGSLLWSTKLLHEMVYELYYILGIWALLFITNEC